MINIDVTNDQKCLAIDEKRLATGIRRALQTQSVPAAQISLAVVDDAVIQRLNRRHLGHDYPTDVLSFLYARDDANMEGEIVVSAETAVAESGRYGWTADDELLLYVVHGALHLVGFDDSDSQKREIIRRHEREILATFGLTPLDEDETDPAPAGPPRQSTPEP